MNMIKRDHFTGVTRAPTPQTASSKGRTCALAIDSANRCDNALVGAILIGECVLDVCHVPAVRHAHAQERAEPRGAHLPNQQGSHRR